MNRAMYINQATTQGNPTSAVAKDNSMYMSQCKTFPHLSRVDAAAYNWVRHLTDADHIAPASVLHNITRYIDEFVLELMAESPTTSPKTLQALAFNPSIKVRQAVADNKKTPVPTLVMLALDDSIDVRYQLAENPNVPEDVLAILAEDENPYVALKAEETLGRNQ